MSEVRLIDANALRAKVCGWFHRDPQEADDQDECAAALCMAIDEAPTIDAVEVVRCACCISFMEYTAEHKQAVGGADGDCRIRMNFSDYPDYYAVKKDDYCSYGTRKGAADGRSD